MTSIYRTVLGAEFERLHPRVAARFGLSSESGVAHICRGRMEEVWHGPAFTLPFLMIGTWRHIMFPRRGRDVPFTLVNYAYRDPYGRETVTWARWFAFGARPSRFEATMILSGDRGRIVDYLGSHQHLAVDIDVSVDERTRGLRLRSGEQRFYERRAAFRFPPLFTGVADVLEWFDDSEDCFRISVDVANERFGPLFGYRGRFTVEERPLTRREIARVIPRRQEARE